MYWKDVFPRDEVRMPNGKIYPAPEYYLRLLEKIKPEMHEKIILKRQQKLEELKDNYTTEKLEAKKLRLTQRLERHNVRKIGND